MLVIILFYLNLSQLIASEEIFDINLPTSHLSQYFNSLSKRWIEKINKTSDENFYKKFINSDQYDKEICWGYEYNCKKPINLHRCTGNHTGYVQSKEVFHLLLFSQNSNSTF